MEEKEMRFLLKLLFAPVMAVLAVVSWFLVFVVGLSSGILCIPAAILGFFGLFIIFVDSVSYGVGLLVVGVAKVQWTVDILRVKVGRWYLPGISALVSLVCAAIILFNPFASTVALWVFIGVALIAEAVVDLLAILWDRLRGA